jgi:hypothetical protein
MKNDKQTRNRRVCKDDTHNPRDELSNQGWGQQPVALVQNSANTVYGPLLLQMTITFNIVMIVVIIGT